MLSDGGDRLKALWFLSFNLLVLAVIGPSAAGQFKSLSGRTSSERLNPTEFASSVKPQVLNADTQPTLRYPVVNFSGISVYSASYGWFDVSRDAVRYTVVTPASKAKEGYELPRKEVADAKVSRTWLMFRGPSKKYNLFYMSQESWGTIKGGPGFMSASVANAPATTSIWQAMTDFDRVLAASKPSPAAPPAEPAAVAQPGAPLPSEPKPAAPATPPAPPAIVLSAPAGAGPNQVVETHETSLVVRGVAIDNTGMPVVTVNGRAANMRPQSAQAAEFWTEPLLLQAGGNRFEIVASNSAHAEARLVFLVHYTPKAAPVNPRALGKEEILSLLHGSVPCARIAEIISDRGLKFTPTAGDLDEIRAAGGDEELVQTIQKARPPA